MEKNGQPSFFQILLKSFSAIRMEGGLFVEQSKSTVLANSSLNNLMHILKICTAKNTGGIGGVVKSKSTDN